MEQKSTILVLRYQILKMVKYGCNMLNWFGTCIMTKNEPPVTLNLQQKSLLKIGL